MQGDTNPGAVARRPVASEVTSNKRPSRAIEAKINRVCEQLSRRSPVRAERSIARDEALEEFKVALIRVLRDEYQRGVLDDIGAAMSRFFSREDAARLELRAELMASIQELRRERWNEVVDEFSEVA